VIPTREDVANGVRAALGDTAVSGGQLYTDAFQAFHLNRAYQELITELDLIDSQAIRREGYYVLPAYTSVLSPATAGLTNFGNPREIRERGTVTTCPISAVTPGSGICTVDVSSPLPSQLVTGANAELFNVGGISPDINDSWAVTLNNSAEIVLNGCAATGTWTSGGTVAYSGEDWSPPLDPRSDTNGWPSSPGSVLGFYVMQRGIIKFPAASMARELKILYNLSASLPTASGSIQTTDSMGIDDALAYLIARTAQYSAQAKGNRPRAADLAPEADNHLDSLLVGAGLDQQSDEPIVPPNFRRHGNGTPGVW
jgi:hypothetical protein